MSDQSYDEAGFAPADRVITMQVQIPDGANGFVSLATMVDQWVGQEALDGMLDRLMASARRIKAKQQIPVRRLKVENGADNLVRLRARLAQMGDEFRLEDQSNAEKRQRLQLKHDEIWTAAAADHIESGRRGGFVQPRGAQKTQSDNLIAAMSAIEAAQKKMDEEHRIARVTLENEIIHTEKEDAFDRKVLADLEALARGEDIAEPPMHMNGG